MTATLRTYQGIVISWGKTETHISFRLHNSEVVFYLFKEDCIHERYARCVHFLTDPYATRTLCISAWTNTLKPVGAVVDRIKPLKYNVYSFLFKAFSSSLTEEVAC